MHCTVGGATLRPTTSDLPFKVREHTIVIVKNLPVLECTNCIHYLIAHFDFSRVEQYWRTSMGLPNWRLSGMLPNRR